MRPGVARIQARSFCRGRGSQLALNWSESTHKLVSCSGDTQFVRQNHVGLAWELVEWKCVSSLLIEQNFICIHEKAINSKYVSVNKNIKKNQFEASIATLLYELNRWFSVELINCINGLPRLRSKSGAIKKKNKKKKSSYGINCDFKIYESNRGCIMLNWLIKTFPLEKVGK
jgi:hypothetical protein